MSMRNLWIAAAVTALAAAAGWASAQGISQYQQGAARQGPTQGLTQGPTAGPRTAQEEITVRWGADRVTPAAAAPETTGSASPILAMPRQTAEAFAVGDAKSDLEARRVRASVGRTLERMRESRSASQ
jgi:hypothetical protein